MFSCLWACLRLCTLSTHFFKSLFKGCYDPNQSIISKCRTQNNNIQIKNLGVKHFKKKKKSNKMWHLVKEKKKKLLKTGSESALSGIYFCLRSETNQDWSADLSAQQGVHWWRRSARWIKTSPKKPFTNNWNEREAIVVTLHNMLLRDETLWLHLALCVSVCVFVFDSAFYLLSICFYLINKVR